MFCCAGNPGTAAFRKVAVNPPSGCSHCFKRNGRFTVCHIPYGQIHPLAGKFHLTGIAGKHEHRLCPAIQPVITWIKGCNVFQGRDPRRHACKIQLYVVGTVRPPFNPLKNIFEFINPITVSLFRTGGNGLNPLLFAKQCKIHPCGFIVSSPEQHARVYHPVTIESGHFDLPAATPCGNTIRPDITCPDGARVLKLLLEMRHPMRHCRCCLPG